MKGIPRLADQDIEAELLDFEPIKKFYRGIIA
jgi:hypothetical protein